MGTLRLCLKSQHFPSWCVRSACNSDDSGRKAGETPAPQNFIDTAQMLSLVSARANIFSICGCLRIDVRDVDLSPVLELAPRLRPKSEASAGGTSGTCQPQIDFTLRSGRNPRDNRETVIRGPSSKQTKGSALAEAWPVPVIRVFRRYS